MSDAVPDRCALLDRLAEEFATRYRRGERPSLQEYADRHPELADELRELLAAMVEIEQVKGHRADLTEAQPSPPTPALQRVGDYLVIREIGRGGMGIVYEAEQVSLGRRVALKVLPAQALKDRAALARFKREARAAARLHHTNIVPVFEVGQDGDLCYYAMQLIPGQGIDEVIEELRRLRAEGHGPGTGSRPAEDPPREAAAAPRVARRVARSLLTGQFAKEDLAAVACADAPPTAHPAAADTATFRAEKSTAASAVLPRHGDPSGTQAERRQYYRSVARIGQQAAQALAHAHARGVIHRDIKPSNLLLDTAGVVWVTDFGLAKSDDDGLTRTGDLVGTLRYMAPERFDGTCDRRADIYALGLTLYELLTLEPAFGASGRLELLEQIRGKDPPKPRALDPRVPHDLETVVLKALERDPGRRYPSADEMAEDLRRFVADEPVRARRVGRAERLWRWCRRNPALSTVSGLAAAALLAVAVLAVGFALQQAAAAGQLRGQQQQTEQALEETRRERRQAQILSTALALDRGLTLARQDEPRRGLLWLARALELAPADADGLRHALRANLAEWGRAIPTLRGRCGEPTPGGTSTPSTPVAVSPDGRLIATGSYQTVRLWDARTGKPSGEPLDHGEPFWQVRFSADGSRLLSGGYINTSWRLWDVRTRRSVGEGLTRTRGSEYAAFSPDSKRLLVATREGAVSLWDARTGAFLRDLSPPAKVRIQASSLGGGSVAAFSPDGLTVLAACSDNAARLFEVATGKPRGEPLRHGGAVYAVAFYPDGTRAFTAGADKVARAWDAAGRPVGQPWQHGAAVGRIELSRDGGTALTVAADNRARVWDTTSGVLRAQTPAHRATLRHARLSPDGRALVTCEYGALAVKVSFWDGATGLPLGQPLTEANGVWDLAFTPDSRSLLVGTDGGRLWDLPRGRSALPPLRHGGRTSAAAFSPDGKAVVTAGEDGVARLWDPATGKEVTPPLLHNGGVTAAAFTPDGRCLLTLATRDTSWRPTGGPGEARVWDAATGKPGAGKLPARLVLAEAPVAGQGLVSTVRFSADGSRLLIGSAGLSRVWDAAAGKPIGAPVRGMEASAPMALRPDGKLLLAGQGMELRLHDAATGQPVGQAMRHRGNGPLLAVAFSPDGKVLASSATDFTARIWDGGTGKPLATLRHPEWVHALAFSPDGKTLATGCGIDVASRGQTHGWGDARLWDATTGKPLGPPLAHGGAVVTVAFSPDGTRVLTGSRDGCARLWDVKTGEPAGGPFRHAGAVVAIAFSPDGKTVASAGADHAARLWDVATGKQVGEPMRHGAALTAIAFSPDGRSVATASRDKTARRWDAATGKLLGAPLAHPHEVLALAFSPDGGALVTGCGQNTGQVSGGFTWAEVRVWDPSTGRPRRAPRLSPYPHDNVLVVSPDGRSFLTAYTGGGWLRRWDLEKDTVAGDPLGRLSIRTAAYGPDGRWLLTGGSLATPKGWRATAQLWDARTGKPRGEVLFQFDRPEAPPGGMSAVHVVAFRRDGKVFLTAAGNTVRLWETVTGRPVGDPLRHHAAVHGAAFSPDGRLVLTLCADNTARLWDAARGKPAGPPLEHRQRVLAMAFSPDGRTAVTAGGTLYDSLEPDHAGFVQLWDVATARPVGGLLSHHNGVTAVAFSPDGRAVLAAGRDGTAQLWGVPGRLPGADKAVVRWAQAVTGMELDEYGAFVPLEDEAVLGRRAGLKEAGGPPLP